MQNLLGKELVRNFHFEVRLKRLVVHSVLNIALGRLEASAHADRLLVGRARCKLSRELGLEGLKGTRRAYTREHTVCVRECGARGGSGDTGSGAQ